MTEPCPMLGFFVAVEPAAGISASARSEFIAAWVTFLAGRGLYAVAASSDTMRWVIASEASQALDADCQAARAWLAARSEVRRAEVGSIVDLNGAT
jgi:uncharacterized protein YggL (DUF469 family)